MTTVSAPEIDAPSLHMGGQMSEILITRSRGSIVECVHFGDVAVVGPAGKLIASCGDADKYTYFRSSAKPIQALNLIISGAAERFGINDQELALVCASHYSEDQHLETARSILAKAGLDESYLRCGAARSIKPEIAFAQAEAGIPPQRIKSDCSGKHSGMLATCAHKGYPLDTYLNPEHSLQQELIAIVSEVCDYPVEKIGVGVDGCGVPVFALPIRNMALAYARFAAPETLPERYRSAAIRIFEAMNAYPAMVSGTGGFCTALMQATGGRMIGKVGAMGVYTIGIKTARLGIALKIGDGSPGMAQVAAMHVLRELDLLTEAEYERLESFHRPPVLNDEGLRVGEVRAVFSLKKNG